MSKRSLVANIDEYANGHWKHSYSKNKHNNKVWLGNQNNSLKIARVLTVRTFWDGFQRSSGNSPEAESLPAGWRIEMHTSPDS